MKEKIKKIPLIGFLVRWLNNLVRLNNLKFKTVVLEEDVKVLKEQNYNITQNLLQLQQEKMYLQQQIDSLKAHLKDMEQNLPKVVAKEIFYESLSLQQRVDQFIFDANIELKTKIAKENE